MAYNYKIIDGRKRDVEDRLRGALKLGPLSALYLPVGGLALAFTSPAITVTFSGSAGDMLPLATVKAEIEAASVSLECEIQAVETGVPQVYDATRKVSALQFIKIWSTTGTITVNTDHAVSTAAALFGIKDGVTLGATGIAKASIISFTQGATPDLYSVLYEV